MLGKGQLPFWGISETNGRTNNEDSFLVFHLSPLVCAEGVTVLALSDGMGGHAHGELASSEALRCFAQFFFEQTCIVPAMNAMPQSGSLEIADLESLLLKAIHHANAHVRRLMESNNWGQTGCTFVGALIQGDQVRATSLGDSPLFLYNSLRHEFTQLSEDHNEAGVLLRAGFITKEMARVHEGRSRLINFIGMEELPRELPLYTIELQPGDRLLLSSDGISSELDEEQLAQVISQAGISLESIGLQLIQKARAAGETDNQTVLLWQHPDADRRKR